MFARNLRDLLNSEGDPEGIEQEEVKTNKNDLFGPNCGKCSGFRHIQADCGNLKQVKRKAIHTTLSDDSSKNQRILALIAPHMLILRSSRAMMKKN
jgi:hypothetical protein